MWWDAPVTKDTPEIQPGVYSALRVHYSQQPFTERELAATPLAQFERWFADAVRAELPEPNAMVVATVDGAGQPSTRHVLLKEADGRGFVFFTNYDSRKGREIAANPRVSLVFPWFGMYRQIVVLGVAERVPAGETEEYFRSRPRGSQLGAWASLQSTEMTSPDELVRRAEALAQQYPEGTDVPVPPNWGGYVVQVSQIEFWAGRESRLHDRLQYVSVDGEVARLDDSAAWKVRRLFP